MVIMKIKKYFKRLLIKLLNNDLEIKELIREIAKSEAPFKIKTTAPLVEQITTVIPIPAIAEPLRQQLATELDLLRYLENDKELRDYWLGNLPDTEGEQLCQLLAIAAQWERILQLWDFLANRCKQAQRAATPEEQALLAGSVTIHNLIWTDKAACLFSAELDTNYDYQQHERATSKGDTIIEEWLSGLKNPAGQVQKHTLVNTR
ncbi:hypothetical protein AADEFJLK_03631 [Methylovulum psychrotolerans]|uniref:Uncharacterized protein n=2 Tax=Methylovulum psychrotolerans TaxID=1704499 RepID=A0A2S5CIV1_9GAMM|nr:hypothetical protein AADEFJLK_03631 [Methylovulum psychrotolerans]